MKKRKCKRHRRLPDQLCINCQRPVKVGYCNHCGHLSRWAEVRTSFHKPPVKSRPKTPAGGGGLWVLPIREEEGDFE